MEKKNKNTTNVKQLQVEEINNTMYLYERDTHDFICQANTIEDLARLSKEYKNKNLIQIKKIDNVGDDWNEFLKRLRELISFSFSKLIGKVCVSIASKSKKSVFSRTSMFLLLRSVWKKAV